MNIMKINSHNHKAPTPKLGTRWILEMTSSEARALVTVIEIFWNKSSWWVRTQTLLNSRQPRKFIELYPLDRFFEIASPVSLPLTGRVDQFCDVYSDKVR